MGNTSSSIGDHRTERVHGFPVITEETRDGRLFYCPYTGKRYYSKELYPDPASLNIPTGSLGTVATLVMQTARDGAQQIDSLNGKIQKVQENMETLTSLVQKIAAQNAPSQAQQCDRKNEERRRSCVEQEVQTDPTPDLRYRHIQTGEAGAQANRFKHRKNR